MNSQSDISGQDLEGRQVGAGTQSDLLWEHLKTVPAFRALLRSVEARFYQHIELPGPILDIGCGDGVFADLTFEQPVAVGVDPWWGPLKKAVRTHAYDLTAQGLGDSLPFASNSFASAFSNSVLEHIPEVQSVLYEIHRVLKPDGRFVATMPSHLYTTELGGAKFLERLRLNSMADLYRRSFNRIARHEQVDPPEIWAARFADAGFAVEQWQYYFSTKALRALEIGHLQGIPSAVLHALTGHWILAPWESNLKITERWVRPFYEEEPPHPGTMILFVLRKLEDRPAAVHLPNPKPIPVLQDKGILPVSPVIGTAAAEAGSARMSSYGVPPVSETELNRSSARSLSLSSLFQSIRNAPKKRWLIVIGILLSFLGYQQANLSSSAGRDSLSLFLWGLSILTALFAFYDGRPSDQLKPLAVPRRPWEIPAVLLLLAISLAFRTVDLTSHPFILSGTEASIGLDAVAVAQGGINNPFSTAWLTNPTMPLYLHAIPVSILGSTILAVRLLSPFIGAATVLAVYWLGRRLFGPGVGLLATVFMTGSHVHIHYSRLGMTNIWDPLVVTLAVGLIYTAWQRRSRNQWLAAGVLIGLNAYFYTSSHLFPLILLGIFVYLLFDWRELWLQRSHIFAAALVALTTALPQILYYMDNPAIFMDRVNALGIVQSGWYLLESEAAGISPAAVIVRQLLTGLLSFQISPDNSPAYMSSGSAFGFWASLLMLVGVLLALWRSKQFRFALLIIWMAAALIFGSGLLENPPQSHRLLIALPAACLLAAIGAIWLVDRALRLTNLSRRYAGPILAAAALVIVMGDVLFYFGEYRDQHLYADRNTEIAHEVSSYINELDGQWQIYFHGAPSMYTSFPTFAYRIDELGKNINFVDVLEPGVMYPADPGANTAYVFLPEYITELQQLQDIQPGGDLLIIPGFHANPLAYLYELKQAS